MKMNNMSNIEEKVRLQYESILPKENIELFKWNGVHYTWKNPNVIDSKCNHWVDEINFGLRMFYEGLCMKEASNEDK